MNDIQTLKHFLSYCPDAGAFAWAAVAKGNRRVKPGSSAGTVSKKGYLRIKVLGVNYAAHRLAWAFIHGEWPSSQIDHKNGNRLDNRISNLRDVPAVLNSQNRSKANPKNSTGLLGVSKSRGKFTACIRLPDVGKVHLGTFEDPQDAHQAYIAAKAVAHAGAIVQRLRAGAYRDDLFALHGSKSPFFVHF